MGRADPRRVPLRAQGLAPDHPHQPARRRRRLAWPTSSGPSTSWATSSARRCSSARPRCGRTWSCCAAFSPRCRGPGEPRWSFATPRGSTTRCTTRSGRTTSRWSAWTRTRGPTPLVPTASWGYLRLRRTEYGDDGAARVGRADQRPAVDGGVRLPQARRGQSGGAGGGDEAAGDDLRWAAGDLRKRPVRDSTSESGEPSACGSQYWLTARSAVQDATNQGVVRRSL